MAGELTREVFEQAMVHLLADLGKPPARQMIYCHPIDEPFLTVLYGGMLRADAQWSQFGRLHRECLRKYAIGPKQSKYDWSLEALRVQYRKKLEELVR